jgi:hypothetical protein
MTRKVWKEFDNVEPRFRARCRALMKRFADSGHELLTDEQFKRQGQFGVGDKRGTQLTITAFKVFQLRVYGGFIPGTRDYVCTEIMATKKRNEADRGVLERAARNLGQFVVDEKKGS